MSQQKELQIKLATLNDIPGILNVLQKNLLPQKQSRTQQDLESQGFLIHGFSAQEIHNSIAHHDDHIVLVATQNNEIVGYTLSYDLQIANPGWRKNIIAPADTIKLIHSGKILYHRHIAASVANQGIGKQLMQTLLQTAQAKSYSHLICQIAHQPFYNKISAGFHKSFGFELVGEGEDAEKLYGIYMRSLS